MGNREHKVRKNERMKKREADKHWRRNKIIFLKKRLSLVVQWLRSCLPKQGTRVRSVVWEGSTCHEAAKPVCHSF